MSTFGAAMRPQRRIRKEPNTQNPNLLVTTAALPSHRSENTAHHSIFAPVWWRARFIKVTAYVNRHLPGRLYVGEHLHQIQHETRDPDDWVEDSNIPLSSSNRVYQPKPYESPEPPASVEIRCSMDLSESQRKNRACLRYDPNHDYPIKLAPSERN